MQIKAKSVVVTVQNDKILEKLKKLYSKIEHRMKSNKSLMSSAYGCFNQNFKANIFEGKEKFLSSLFAKSEVLTGVMPYLLYFNIDNKITDFMYTPKRLFP